LLRRLNALACAALGGRCSISTTSACVTRWDRRILWPSRADPRVCDSPTMLKTVRLGRARSPRRSSREGFTGAPALTVEHDDARGFW
jgi:hypothetical protein